MRPTSVVFLILSVILIAGGVVTCVSAQKIAEANAIELFAHEFDENLNGIETHEFDDVNTNKITLNLKDVNVNIIGNAEATYIKLTNFSKNTFEYSISNKNLTVDDSLNLYSLFQFTAGGLDFNGLRHFIYYDKFKDKQKSVDVYINKQQDIKQFDISVGSGIITVSNIPKQADFLIKVGDGEVNISNMKIISTISVKIDTGDFNINTVSMSGAIDAVIDNGNVYANIKNSNYRGYRLSAENGIIDFFGEPKSNVFNLEPIKETTSLNADVKNGNIYITPNIEVESNVIPEK